jgi:glycosyltransferase involved in cell wall biosynthesis
MDIPLVSVVLSFRNEAENIPTLISRLAAVFVSCDAEYELLFVNDASTDQSMSVLMAERERNARVKILNLSRRFGVAEGVMAGMAWAGGDAVIYMDVDLQDPPELIPLLLERWRGGADVVHTVRTNRRGESVLRVKATRLAYRLIQYGSTIDLPVDAGDFKLLSRRAVNHLLGLRESDPYLRGLVAWLGFNQVVVPYERAARHAGKTHFPFFSRNPWKTFVTGVTSFSFLPIYACLALAGAGLVVSALVFAFALAVGGTPTAGPAALIALLLFLWATTVGAIGIVGVYIVRIYKDVRGRPAYLVQSTFGLSKRNSRKDTTPAGPTEAIWDDHPLSPHSQGSAESQLSTGLIKRN